MRAYGLVMVLFLVGVVRAETPKEDATKTDVTKGDTPFDEITPKQIEKLINQAKAQKAQKTKIDGSDNKDNQLPEGTILCFVTSDQRYGKLKVVKYGYNLTIKWVTYDKDGAVFSKGDRLTIRGTWSCDLDYGVEGNKGKSRTDFWWEQVNRTVRHFVFTNGAVFTLYPEMK